MKKHKKLIILLIIVTVLIMFIAMFFIIKNKNNKYFDDFSKDRGQFMKEDKKSTTLKTNTEIKSALSENIELHATYYLEE